MRGRSDSFDCVAHDSAPDRPIGRGLAALTLLTARGQGLTRHSRIDIPRQNPNMPPMTEQKIILITGCSSGIGCATALVMRDAGWRVLATARQAVDVERLRGEGFESFVVDYADTGSLEAARDYIVQNCGGRIDALFNNGAFACPGAAEDLPRGALREIFETNVFGLHELTTLIIPLMRAQGFGRVLNCSSVLGVVTAPWRGAYVSTKFALEGLTDTLRVEMADTPIKFILINPGPITSKIRANSIPHFERWIDWKNSPRKAQYETLLHRLYEDNGPDKYELPARDVGELVLRACDAKSPKARYFITVPAKMASRLKRILPTAMLDRMLAKI